MLLSSIPSDIVKISDLHKNYVKWCEASDIALPCVKENLGKAIHKMFGKQKVKAMQKKGDLAYYYEKMVYVMDEFWDEHFKLRIKLPEYVTFDLEHEMLCMHIPTTFMEDNVLQEYHVYMNRKSDQYWVHFRGIELDSSFLGLGKYSEFDQMFVNSITRICEAFICQGRYVNLPRGRSDSKNLVKTVIAKMGPDGNAANVREVTVSKNCQKVLL